MLKKGTRLEVYLELAGLKNVGSFGRSQNRWFLRSAYMSAHAGGNDWLWFPAVPNGGTYEIMIDISSGYCQK